MLKACSLVAAELVLLLQKFKKEKDEEEKKKKRKKKKKKKLHIFAAALVNLSLQSTCSQLQAHSLQQQNCAVATLKLWQPLPIDELYVISSSPPPPPTPPPQKQNNNNKSNNNKMGRIKN